MSHSIGMGWRPDVPSIKDFTPDTAGVTKLLKQVKAAKVVTAVATAAGSGAAAAPALVGQVDLRSFCSPIEDQGHLGSCTANAAAGLMEFFERKASGKHVDASRLFIYKTTRNLLGWTGDTGAYLRSAMEALVAFGAPPEKYLPYNIAHFDDEPSAFCYAFAEDYQATKYFRLDPNGTTPAQTLQNVKAFLAAGLPSIFGFPVYNEYMYAAADGKIPVPAPQSHLFGGHANMAVGYDDNLVIGATKGALLVRNSWGTSWGDHGYGWLSYGYVSQALALDWWSLLDQKWIDTGNF